MRRAVALLVSVTLFISMLVLGVVSKMQAQQGQQGQPCTLATLNATYGIISTGFFQGGAPTAPAASNPFAEVGIVGFDGAGHALLRATFSASGNIGSDNSAATYTVTPDCTGTITVSPPQTGAANFVIVAHGSELLIILTNAGQVQTAIAIKQ